MIRKFLVVRSMIYERVSLLRVVEDKRNRHTCRGDGLGQRRKLSRSQVVIREPCKGMLDDPGVREQHNITTHHGLGYASQPFTDTQIGFSFH